MVLGPVPRHARRDVAATPSPEGRYLRSGSLRALRLGNLAHYRLMFGPTLTTGEGGLPAVVAEAAAGAKAVPGEAILHGAQAGHLAVSPASQAELNLAVLLAWSPANTHQSDNAYYGK